VTVDGDGGSARILAVDDEARNLDLLAALLGRAGYHHVTLLSDPRGALERFDAIAPDLVLLDLHMPGLDGFEMLERIAGLVAEDDRLVAVVDVFDALTHRRPYKPAWPVEAAVGELLKERGGQFDGDIVDAFVGLLHGGRIVVEA
jgi:response regulator RpfG family c-di-GMP phosphodiesterase